MQKQNIIWIDVLRVIACFMVVLSHCCDPFVGQFDSNRTAFLTGEFIGSAMRPCVPLFAMMTGVLLFPVRTDMHTFYKKRIGRLLWPLVFWSLALPVLYYTYVHFGPSASNSNIDPSQFTWQAQLTKMYTFVFNFNYDTTPLWYLYMLVGLYLIMPVVSTWLQQADRKDIRLFLKVWILSLFVPYLQLFAPVLGYTGNYGNMGLLGVCDWNAYGTFHYASGFLGYIILGHYLVRFPLTWSKSRIRLTAILLFLAGYLITAFGFDAIQQRYPGDYAYLEIIWLFSGINVFMMTIAVFLVVQTATFRHRVWVNRLASLSFGIYLAHFVFVQAAYDLYSSFLLPPIVRIPLMAVSAFGITAVVVRLIQAVPVLRKTVQ